MILTQIVTITELTPESRKELTKYLSDGRLYDYYDLEDIAGCPGNVFKEITSLPGFDKELNTLILMDI